MEFEKKSNQYAGRLKDVYDAGSNSSVEYPEKYLYDTPVSANNLSSQLKLIARLLSGGVKTKIFLCRIGAFDTGFRIAMDYEFFRRAGRAGAGFRRVPEVLAHMPDTGVSSQLDWPALTARFAEERRVHLRHCPGPAMRAVYAAYWPAYLVYRRVRALF